MRIPLLKRRAKNTVGMDVMSGLAPTIQNRMEEEMQPKVMAYEKRMVDGIPGSQQATNLKKVNEENLTIDHNSNEWKVLPSSPDEEKKKIVKFVKEQFDIAYRARQEMELEWAMAVAFFEGRQWFRLASQTRNLVSIQSKHEPNRYITVNKMRPLIDGVVGKLTQVGSDVRAVPLSDNERDLLASEEANHICGHYKRYIS